MNTFLFILKSTLLGLALLIGMIIIVFCVVYINQFYPMFLGIVGGLLGSFMLGALFFSD